MLFRSESCAGGGGRIDLGILERTDRVWTSDSNDPLERLENQRHTGIVVPPEMLDMHLTSPVVHSSGRTVSLGLSGAVALFGHFGIEWDLTTLDDATRADIAEWVALATRLRPLIASGRVVHVDGTEPGIDVRGMVAPDAAALSDTAPLVAGENFLIAKRIPLGPLMDLIATFLDTLEAEYDLFVRYDDGGSAFGLPAALLR